MTLITVCHVLSATLSKNGGFVYEGFYADVLTLSIAAVQRMSIKDCMIVPSLFITVITAVQFEGARSLCEGYWVEMGIRLQ